MKTPSFVLIGLILLSAALGWTQVEMANYADLRGPKFHLDLSNVAVPGDPTLSRVNLYAEIEYNELQFIKTADGFEADYELSVVILDKDKDQVDGKIWKEAVYVDRYDDTNRRDTFSFTSATFDLEPGTYKISVTLQDLETERTTKIDRRIKLADFSKDKLQLSDIIFLRDIEFDSSGAISSIYPTVTSMTKGLLSRSFAYFEIYNPQRVSEAEIRYEIYGINSRKRIKRSYTRTLGDTLVKEAIPIKIDSLNHDSYKFKVALRVDGKKKAETEKQFYVRWTGLPKTSKDLETAIEQLRYIATREEWKRLKKAKGEDRIKEFIAFWKRHDPTPGTEENEAMEAHYSRVDYANQYFSQMQREGWRTDMGMVFIILGAPDDIERNAYPRYSKPYEIWRYYRYNRELLFYDQTGFGEYRLATPFSIYEFQRYLRQ